MHDDRVTHALVLSQTIVRQDSAHCSSHDTRLPCDSSPGPSHSCERSQLPMFTATQRGRKMPCACTRIGRQPRTAVKATRRRINRLWHGPQEQAIYRHEQHRRWGGCGCQGNSGKRKRTVSGAVVRIGGGVHVVVGRRQVVSLVAVARRLVAVAVAPHARRTVAALQDRCDCRISRPAANPRFTSKHLSKLR